MSFAKTLLLFVATASAELLGCWLTYAWLRQGRTAWLVVLSAISLAAFAWLLTLHPTSSGRVYASYGGIYVAGAVVWLWLVDGQVPDRWDLVGAALTITGTLVIAFGPRGS